jgi:hypothetical protein
LGQAYWTEGLTLEEEGGLVGDEISRKVLTGVCEASDQSSSEISASEEIDVAGGSTELSLNLDSSLDHG